MAHSAKVNVSSHKTDASGSVGDAVLQTNSLKSLLAKDPKHRKAANIGKIRQLLIKNDFFLMLDNLKRRLFCKAILYHSLAGGQHLFDEGRRAEKIFIIQKGSCKVFFRNRELRTAGPGDVLGEACVLDESVYHETVIADSSKVEAIVLLKKDYFDICATRRKSKLINHKVLSNMSWFNHLKEQAIERLLYYSTISTGEHGKCICKEGRPAHSVIVVIQGSLEVRKRISPAYGNRPSTPAHNSDKVEDHVIDTNEVFPVAELHDEDFFGAFDANLKPTPIYACDLYISKRCKYISVPIQCFQSSLNIQGLTKLFQELLVIDEKRHELWDLHYLARNRLQKDSVIIVEETVDKFESETRAQVDSITAKSPPRILPKGDDKSIAHQSWVFRMKPRKPVVKLSLDKLIRVEKESKYASMYKTDALMKYEREERLHRKRLKSSNEPKEVKKALVQDMVVDGKFKISRDNDEPHLFEKSVRDAIPLPQRIDDLVATTQTEIDHIDKILEAKLASVKERRIKQNKALLERGRQPPGRRKKNGRIHKIDILQKIKLRSKAKKERKIQAVLNSIEDLNKEINKLSPNLPVRLSDLKHQKRGERPFPNGVAALAALKLAAEEKNSDPVIPKKWVAESPHRSKDPTLLNNFVQSMNTGLME